MSSGSGPSRWRRSARRRAFGSAPACTSNCTGTGRSVDGEAPRSRPTDLPRTPGRPGTSRAAGAIRRRGDGLREGSRSACCRWRGGRRTTTSCRLPPPEYLRSSSTTSVRVRISTGDTDIGQNSWEVAARAAGAALNAVDSVCEGGRANAFCLVRPPGHHATRAAAWASACSTTSPWRRATRRRTHGLERVADRRLGRAPRQRHAGHLLRRPRRALSSARTSGRFYPGTGASGPRAGAGAGEAR